MGYLFYDRCQLTVLDNVYILVKQDRGIWYSPPAPDPMECWLNAWKWEVGLGVDFMYDPDEGYKGFQARMQKDGWRAKKVSISLLTN